MSRPPIRARITVVFAIAMIAVLAGAAWFVYTRLRDDLDEDVRIALTAHAAAVARSGTAVAAPGGDPEESFSALLRADGSVRDGPPAAAAILSARERAVARRGELVIDRRVPGIDGATRVLARPAPAGAAGIVLVGRTLEDRDETLGELVSSFLVGGPVAVLLASLLGYGLATAALAPIEAMRARAADISLAGAGQRLPLPDARDEVRRLGETLNAMLARIERSLARERRFVADASHELRTPIAVVKTELEGALRGVAPDQHAVRDGLRAALEEVDQMAALVEDMLVLATAADGALPVRAERIDVREVLVAAQQRFAGRAAAGARRIEVVAPGRLNVHADPQRLRQALGNLVDNALRHGTGTVTLEARAGGGGVELSVTDEGPGFSGELAATAFERFARGDPARRRGGAGLGLAIVRAVAGAHGGHATAGVGTPARVTLWLPGGRDDAVGSGASQVARRA